MCRSIKILRQPAATATEDEVRAAALQFVRKISGTRKPSRADQDAFDHGVDEIAAASLRLLKTMTPRRAPGGLKEPKPSTFPGPGEVVPIIP